MLVFVKFHSFLQLIFSATELQKRRKFNIFEKALFCILAFQLEQDSIALFPTKNQLFLKFPWISQEVKTKNKSLR